MDIDEIEHGLAIDGTINAAHGCGNDGCDHEPFDAYGEVIGDEVSICGVAVMRRYCIRKEAWISLVVDEEGGSDQKEKDDKEGAEDRRPDHGFVGFFGGLGCSVSLNESWGDCEVI